MIETSKMDTILSELNKIEESRKIIFSLVTAKPDDIQQVIENLTWKT